MGTLATRYHGLFTITACVLVAYRLIIWSTSQRPAVQSKQGAAKSAQFAEWQRGYLIIFLLAAVSDWLQGPYVYELYVSYGFSEKAIAELFVCGFGSSLVFGTMLGGVADKMGRKRVCLLYCILYTCDALRRTLTITAF